MAEKTEISWTDSTFNPWWGCSKVSPGCNHCYAEALDRRTGGNHWGAGSAPRPMSTAYWTGPLKWNKRAAATQTRRRVFCGSMCDVFDDNAPAFQRSRLYDLIRQTPWLDWLLLTKRAQNIQAMLPGDWGNGWANVWLGVSVENRMHGLPRIKHLQMIPARVRFLSCEPLLEDLETLDLTGIHWVIAGGEAGPGARTMQAQWVESLMRQCADARVPMFFKQWGGRDKTKGGSLIAGGELKQWPKI